MLAIEQDRKDLEEFIFYAEYLKVLLLFLHHLHSKLSAYTYQLWTNQSGSLKDEYFWTHFMESKNWKHGIEIYLYDRFFANEF